MSDLDSESEFELLDPDDVDFVSERAMIVLLVKQVHLQKDGAEGSISYLYHF